ncbi:hypothetical protein HPG69_009147 [Diceros bicornis minor]|uniref:Uncharacterized protein n=1 Tax=Diceros bicornis minor TaxID=77932 RepID=A0A7J7F108_DICBM|nr:hypothetical protein HPG69_009147 [Diceros bicornis minor]
MEEDEQEQRRRKVEAGRAKSPNDVPGTQHFPLTNRFIFPGSRSSCSLLVGLRAHADRLEQGRVEELCRGSRGSSRRPDRAPGPGTRKAVLLIDCIAFFCLFVNLAHFRQRKTKGDCVHSKKKTAKRKGSAVDAPVQEESPVAAEGGLQGGGDVCKSTSWGDTPNGARVVQLEDPDGERTGDMEQPQRALDGDGLEQPGVITKNGCVLACRSPCRWCQVCTSSVSHRGTLARPFSPTLCLLGATAVPGISDMRVESSRSLCGAGGPGLMWLQRTGRCPEELERGEAQPCGSRAPCGMAGKGCTVWEFNPGAADALRSLRESVTRLDLFSESVCSLQANDSTGGQSAVLMGMEGCRDRP